MWRDRISKYRAVTYSRKIEVVNIERESDKCVWLKPYENRKEQRELKISESVGYFDTWEEAREFLLKMADIKVQDARRTLEYYKSLHGNVLGLTNAPK